MRSTVSKSCAAALALAACSHAYAADAWPTRPIRFINPTAPGGTAEPIARVIAQRMSETLGQTVVVDSRGGAGGTVGTAMAATSPPDGYTILLGVVSPMAINVSLYGSKLPYDPLKSFAPVSIITKVPQMLSVHPGVQATSLKQLVALAKDPNSRLNYGSAGSGTTGHLVAELLKKRAGIVMTHVPFKGSGPALAATLGGEPGIMFSGPPAVVSHAHAGRLRVLAGSGVKRSPVLPDVPTFIESGLPIDVTSWYCLVVPAGTPQRIVERLHAAVVESLKSREVADTLLRMGAPPEWSTPEQLRAFLRAEISKFAEVVQLAGAKID
ncbi:MAG TPA: tripartite tricarboxylate transporter substrate binding protein [Burkholderiales bacterium]|nr:tripartite tricarboxylate transporter substrate binding protein [Burkholderiales bacterium]